MVAITAGALSSVCAASARQPRPDPEPEPPEIRYVPGEIVVFPRDPFDSPAIAQRMKDDGFLILGRGAVSGMILAATAPVPGIEEIMCEYLRTWPEVRAAVRDVAGEPLGRQPTTACPPVGTYTSNMCNQPFATGQIQAQTICSTPPPTGHPDDPTFCQQWGLHNTGQNLVDLTFWESATPPETKCWLQTARAGVDVNLLAAWEHTTGDPRVTVAIFDSGVEDCNPDFDPERFLPSGLVYTCAGNNSYDYPCCPGSDCDFGPPTDNNGHGTFAASIIGAVADNGIGMTGIDQQCKLLAARVFDPTPPAGCTTGTPLSVGYARVIMAFEEIYANPAYESVRVINCSFKLPYDSSPEIQALVAQLGAAINACIGQHRFVVAGAGNSGPIEGSSLQMIEDVIVVGGIDGRGWRFSHPHSSFLGGTHSSYGPELDFMAPGMAHIGLTAQREGCCPLNYPCPCTDPVSASCPYRMRSSVYASRHNYETGTSFAAPMVCGAISLILAKAIECGIIVPEENDWSALTIDDMYEILKAGCRDQLSWEQYPPVLGDPEDISGHDEYYGWGLIDIDASLEYFVSNYCEP